MLLCASFLDICEHYVMSEIASCSQACYMCGRKESFGRMTDSRDQICCCPTLVTRNEQKEDAVLPEAAYFVICHSNIPKKMFSPQSILTP